MHIAIDMYQQTLMIQQKADAAVEEGRHVWESSFAGKGRTKAFKRFEHACEKACELSTKTNLARSVMMGAIDLEAKENYSGGN